MVEEESSRLVGVLVDGQREFHAALDGLSESDAAAHPQPNRWSALECVEHVTVAEGRFARWLERADRAGAPRADRDREADLMARVLDRAAKAVAPEAVLPTGRFPTLAEALAEFDASRARTIEFVESRGQDLDSLTVEHPRFGPMNGAELVAIIAGHALRHAEQIREIRAANGQRRGG